MRQLAALAILAGLAAPGVAGDAEPPRVNVYPPEIELSTSRDRQSYVVQVTGADGVTRDVTDEAKVEFSAPLVGRQGNVLTPKADGEGRMIVSYGGRVIPVPLTVKQSQADRPISFKLDVMPVFMRAGCNTGACHGAARGKDGFRLSLFGFDPDGDWYRLTREMSGRRISVAIPQECLLMEKSTGAVQHSGGERFKADTELYKTLSRWLDAGAPKDGADVAFALEDELGGEELQGDGLGAAQRMTVRAKYSDGTD
ncbi:MAG TPA: cell surface protein, partial [Planctomycetota bacterium]|nr:cell surface protein [Planctomycetota bacterium]